MIILKKKKYINNKIEKNNPFKENPNKNENKSFINHFNKDNELQNIKKNIMTQSSSKKYIYFSLQSIKE